MPNDESHSASPSESPNEDEPRIRRATARPPHVKAPAHWSKTDAPKPDPIGSAPALEPLDPVRYGDWEKNGVAVDF